MIIYVYNKLCSKETERNNKYIINKLKEIYHEFIVIDFVAFRDLDYKSIDIIIIGGGDGSINRIVNETNSYNITYAFIPLGTANDFARSLGITSINKGLKIIKRQKENRYEVCKVNGKLFLYGLSIGKINKIPLNVKQSHKKIFKKNVYIINGLKNLKLKKEIVKYNDREMSAIGIIIIKTKYLGGLRIHNSDKAYNVVIIKNIFDLIKLFFKKSFQEKLSKEKEIFINTNNFCLDGEYYKINSKEKETKLSFTFTSIKILI